MTTEVTCVSATSEVPKQSSYCQESHNPAGIYTSSSWIEGPRMARLPEFIKKLAQRLDLEVKLDIHTRLIRETVFFEVTGSLGKIDEFSEEFSLAVNEYKGKK